MGERCVTSQKTAAKESRVKSGSARIAQRSIEQKFIHAEALIFMCVYQLYRKCVKFSFVYI